MVSVVIRALADSALDLFLVHVSCNHFKMIFLLWCLVPYIDSLLCQCFVGVVYDL